MADRNIFDDIMGDFMDLHRKVARAAQPTSFHETLAPARRDPYQYCSDGHPHVYGIEPGHEDDERYITCIRPDCGWEYDCGPGKHEINDIGECQNCRFIFPDDGPDTLYEAGLED